MPAFHWPSSLPLSSAPKWESPRCCASWQCSGQTVRPSATSNPTRPASGLTGTPWLNASFAETFRGALPQHLKSGLAMMVSTRPNANSSASTDWPRASATAFLIYASQRSSAAAWIETAPWSSGTSTWRKQSSPGIRSSTAGSRRKSGRCLRRNRQAHHGRPPCPSVPLSGSRRRRASGLTNRS